MTAAIVFSIVKMDICKFCKKYCKHTHNRTSGELYCHHCKTGSYVKRRRVAFGRSN